MDTVSQQILALEAQFFRTSGAKDQAITGLGLTPVRYYQLLNQLLDSPAALESDPLLVKRLLRVRTNRRRSTPRR